MATQLKCITVYLMKLDLEDFNNHETMEYALQTINVIFQHNSHLDKFQIPPYFHYLQHLKMYISTILELQIYIISLHNHVLRNDDLLYDNNNAKKDTSKLQNPRGPP